MQFQFIDITQNIIFEELFIYLYIIMNILILLVLVGHLMHIGGLDPLHSD